MNPRTIDKISDVLAALSMIAVGIFALMGVVIVFLILTLAAVAMYSQIVEILAGIGGM